jgi:hypothetical protein
VVDLPPILAGLAWAALLGLGVGTLNCAIAGLVPVWENVWSIITRPLFLASGVFFTYEDMPRPVQEVLWWNPLLHVTGTIRTGFYPSYDATYVSGVFVLGVSGIAVAAGLLLLGRYWRDILEREPGLSPTRPRIGSPPNRVPPPGRPVPVPAPPEFSPSTSFCSSGTTRSARRPCSATSRTTSCR